MEKILMIQTFDNKLHKDTRDAKRHLDKLYSDLMAKVVHEIIDATNTKPAINSVSDYIEGNLTLFQDLRTITNDMKLVKNEYFED